MMEQSTEKCRNHTDEMHLAMTRGAPWALAMYDSETKMPTGILLGLEKHFGNYDECLNVEVHEDFGSFKGQHCMTHVTLPIFGNITWSVCVPSSCLPSDIEKNLLRTYNMEHVSVDPLLCHVKETKPFTPIELGSMCIISIFVLLAILSTIYDFAVKSPAKRKFLLLSFSWYTNGKRLMDPTNAPDDTLHAVHGIRVIAMWWLICMHVYQAAYEQFSGINRVAYYKISTDWYHLFLTANMLQIDIYFLLSGLLLCYLYLRDREHGRHFNIIHFYVNRYLRVTPCLAVIVLVNATLLSRLGSGPIWEHNILRKQNDCWNYGWTLLIFIRNYIEPHTCLIQSWPLNVDMQMYLLSPLFLIPLHKWPKVGIIILTTSIFGGIIIVFTEGYIHKIPVGIFKYGRLRTVQDMYMQTHTHSTPWLVGLGLGYILYQFKRREKLQQTILLSKAKMTLGWVLCILALIGSHLIAHPFLQPDYQYNALESSFTLALTRPIWALGISWIIFACVTGYAGILNSFLSYDVFLLLSRFAYGTTVVHSTVVQARAFSIRTNTYVSDFSVFSVLIADVVLSLIGGVLMALIVEVPIINISKYFLDTKFEKRRFVIQFSLDEVRTSNPSHESITNDVAGVYVPESTKNN